MADTHKVIKTEVVSLDTRALVFDQDQYASRRLL